MTKSNRINKLRANMAEKSLDSFLISSAENRHYFSGFRGSAGFLWITHSEAILITDFRYTEQAELQAPDFKIIRLGKQFDWLNEVLYGKKEFRIGFEDLSLPVSNFNSILNETRGVSERIELVPTSSLADEIRSVKEPEEIELLTKAILIADHAMESTAEKIRPKMSEKEIAWMLEQAMRENGADALSFDTIVASGTNGAKPHHKPTDRKLDYGDAVTIDMGALYDGYCSDITRTFVLGKANEKFIEVYDTVLSAMEVAESTATSGMTGKEIDGLARNIIINAGYGDAFGHSLGHGIGVAVHEYPRVGPFSSDQLIENGMVFSIEPGIYLTGWGGIRIEDLVVMENGHPRVLTTAHKRELIEL